jgi:hypothetical protein
MARAKRVDQYEEHVDILALRQLQDVLDTAGRRGSSG